MKKTVKNRRKRIFPNVEALLVFGLIMKLVVSSGFLLFYNGGENLTLGPGSAYAQDEEKSSETEKESDAEKPAPPPSETTLSKQYRGMIEALKRREDALKIKEQQLNERSKALDILEKELKDRLTEIDETRNRLEELVAKHEKLVKEQQVLKDARIEHLVTAYKGMRPEKAGKLVDSLDDEVAVQILSAMPGRNAGQILAFVEPEKAARLTKAISDRKLPMNATGEDKKN